MTPNPQSEVILLPTVGAKVTLKGAGALTASSSAVQPGSTTTQPYARREYTPGTEKVVYWGASNAFPQKASEHIRRSTIIPRALDDIASLWVGGGLIATDGTSEDPIPDLDIRTFLASRATKKYLFDAAKSIATWRLGFAELIVSRNRNLITTVECKKTPYCRWGRMNQQGLLDTVYMSANWPNATENDQETSSRPALNPNAPDLAEWVRTQSGFNFFYPVMFQNDDTSYYPVTPWDSARSSGWLDVLEAIPNYKKQAMLNQMTLRYHIEVDQEYWPNVYADRWEQGDFEARKAIRQQFLDDLINKLTGVDNANRAVLTDMWNDASGKPTGVKITVLDDPHLEGKYNDDYSEGASHLLYSLGVDPTLFGFSSGKEGGRSGGSDKREAFWIFLSKSKPFRDRIIEPIEFIAEYNGWKTRYPNLQLRFIDTLLTTLDTGKSTTQTTSPQQ
jgi:hypothetical protein